MSLSPHIFNFNKATNLVLINTLPWMLYSFIPMILYHPGDMPCRERRESTGHRHISRKTRCCLVQSKTIENFLNAKKFFLEKKIILAVQQVLQGEIIIVVRFAVLLQKHLEYIEMLLSTFCIGSLEYDEPKYDRL